MRKINLTNEKKRDAQVGFEGCIPKNAIQYVLPDGRARKNVRILKSSLDTDLDDLVAQYGGLEQLSGALIAEDPEIDLEQTGRFIDSTRKIYLDQNNNIVYSVNLQQVVYGPDGIEKERREYSSVDANISTDSPLRWTGKMLPKNKAVVMFVFSRKYQIRHVNGLTFDFLYDIAKQLHDANSMMLLGAGEKGNAPLVFSSGGVSYRGFLEGRIKDETYCLILHLSNLELKEIVQ